MVSPISAGALRSRVSFFKRTVVSDGYGNDEGEYSDTPEFTVAANVRPKLGGEDVLAGRLSGRNLVVVTVRQSSATQQIAPDWKAVDARSGEQFAIRSVIDPNEGNALHGATIELLCEKGVAI